MAANPSHASGHCLRTSNRPTGIGGTTPEHGESRAGGRYCPSGALSISVRTLLDLYLTLSPGFENPSIPPHSGGPRVTKLPDLADSDGAAHGVDSMVREYLE